MLRGTLLCCLAALTARGQDFAPLPMGGLEPAHAPEHAAQTFLKPTKSIKPPVSASAPGPAAAQPQVNAPVAARLRRLILMPGGLSPEAVREQITAGGQALQPMTVVGMQAPAPVLADLAGFFGGTVNADTQKKLIETVRHGLGNADKPRRVELLGWLPREGVMALAVYPES